MPTIWGPFPRRLKTGIVYYVRIPYDDVDGRRKERWESLGTSSKQEAVRAMAALERALESRAARENQGVAVLTHELAWQRYVAAEGAGLKAYTLENYNLAWRQFWNWAAAQPRPINCLHQTDPLLFCAWRDWLAAPKPAGNGNSNNTVNDYLTTISTIFNKLKAARVYHDNPVATVKRLPEVEPNKDWLEPEEISRVLLAARDLDKDILLHFALGLFAGFRLEEITLCEWTWFQFASAGQVGVINIPAYNKDTGFDTKNGTSRSLPLDPKLAEILAPFRSLSGFVVQPLKTAWNPRYYRYDCRKRFQRALKNAGISKEITNHNLRHSFISNAVKAGIDYLRIMDWVGHEDVQTLRIYAHLKPKDSTIERVYPEVTLPGVG